MGSNRDIRRIVVRGTNWVGDAIMTIPALWELRRILPDAHITLATRSWTKGIFAGAPFVDDLLIYDREGPIGAPFRQIAEWRRRKFDAAILFQNAFEAALIARFASVPVRLGYATDGRSYLLTHRVVKTDEIKQQHEVYYYLNLVAEFERWILGRSPDDQPAPRMELPLAEGQREAAAKLLTARGIRADRPVVALCPGSTNSRAKRWPAERFAALADRLIEELNAQVILIGAADELPVSREVESAMQHRPIILTGATNLADAVGVLDLSSTVGSEAWNSRDLKSRPH